MSWLMHSSHLTLPESDVTIYLAIENEILLLRVYSDSGCARRMFSSSPSMAISASLIGPSLRGFREKTSEFVSLSRVLSHPELATVLGWESMEDMCMDYMTERSVATNNKGRLTFNSSLYLFILGNLWVERGCIVVFYPVDKTWVCTEFSSVTADRAAKLNIFYTVLIG